MVRRSARLRNKAPEEDSGETNSLEERSQDKTLENLVKSTYELIKERIKNSRESFERNVENGEDGREKAEEFISLSSRVKDNVSKYV